MTPMMVTIYLDGFPVERCFTMKELNEAVKYWQARGEVTWQNDPTLIALYGAQQS